jgi:hypothetical protein
LSQKLKVVQSIVRLVHSLLGFRWGIFVAQIAERGQRLFSMQPDLANSPEAQQIFRAVYDMSYYMYSHWPAFLEQAPEVQSRFAALAMTATMLTVSAQRDGFPMESVVAVRDAAQRAARLQVSNEGGPYRVRFANIIRNAAGRYAYEIGRGEGNPGHVAGLLPETPIEDGSRGLHLYIYREPDISPEVARKLAQALIDADKVS